MTKEFENFQQLLAQKQNELDIQTRAAQKVKDDEAARKQEEERQKKLESEQRASENKRVFENYGVVKLLEEIRDTGIVKSSEEILYPSKWVSTSVFGTRDLVFDKSIKLNDFTPATIIWGDENKFIELRFNGGYYGGEDYDYFRLDLLSNKKIGTTERIRDPNYPGHRIGVTKDSYWVYGYINQETEIANIPEYIASKIVNPDHHSETSYPEPN